MVRKTSNPAAPCTPQAMWASVVLTRVPRSRLPKPARPTVAKPPQVSMTESGRASKISPPGQKKWSASQLANHSLGATENLAGSLRPPKGQSNCEGASTAATTGGLGVLEHKPLPHQVFLVVEGGVRQVDVALRVHEQPRAVLLEHFVAGARLGLHAHRVGQPGAAASLHADAQPARIGRHALLRHQLTNFLGRLLGYMDHSLGPRFAPLQPFPCAFRSPSSSSCPGARLPCPSRKAAKARAGGSPFGPRGSPRSPLPPRC